MRRYINSAKTRAGRGDVRSAIQRRNHSQHHKAVRSARSRRLTAAIHAPKQRLEAIPGARIESANASASCWNGEAAALRHAARSALTPSRMACAATCAVVQPDAFLATRHALRLCAQWTAL